MYVACVLWCAVCHVQVLFDKAPNSVWNLRPDSLALLLSLANVGAGSRCLVLDNCQVQEQPRGRGGGVFGGRGWGVHVEGHVGANERCLLMVATLCRRGIMVSITLPTYLHKCAQPAPPPLALCPCVCRVLCQVLLLSVWVVWVVCAA